MNDPVPFSTLLWRRFVLFLAATAGTIQVVTHSFWVTLPFWIIAAIVQDWELHSKERR